MAERQNIVTVLAIIGIIISAVVLYQVGGINPSLKNLSNEVSDLSNEVSDLSTAETDLVGVVADLTEAFSEEMKSVSEQISAIEARLGSVEDALVTEPAPEQEQVLVLAHQRSMTGIGAYRVQGAGFAIVIANDPFFTYDQEGLIIPHLVESCDVSTDGLVYTWNLKKGVKFHCGEPFNAEAVKFTFEYATNPLNPNYGIFTNIDRTEIVDEYKVKIYLNELNVFFLDDMASTSGYPVCRHHAEEYGEDYGITEWCGVGPFKLVEHIHEYHTIYVKNEEYNWGPPWHTGPPLLDKIIIEWIPEGTVITVSLIAGDIDAAIDLGIDQYETLDASPKVEILLEEVLQSSFLAFNLENPPFDDIRMRTAVAHAIDKEILWEQKLKTTVIAASPIPPKLGVKDRFDLAPEYDLDKANGILDELGWVMANDGIRYKDGEPLIVNLAVYERSASQKPIAVLVQDMVAKIGIKANIIMGDWPTLVDMIQRGEHHMVVQGFSWSNLASSRNFFHSDSIGVYNFAHVNDTEMDALIDLGPTIVDEIERLAIYQKIVDKVVGEVIYVPTMHATLLGATSTRVKNFRQFDVNTRTPIIPLLDCYIESD